MAESKNYSNILHESLMRCALSVEVVDVDIRRDFSGMRAHEDDVRGTVRSQESGEGSVGRRKKTTLASAITSLAPIETDYILQVKCTDDAEKLDAYRCSKRYVDFRNLASELRDHAEEVVNFYEGKKDKMQRGFDKLLHKPVEVAQFITNTETRKTLLASDLDGVFQNRKTVVPKRKLTRRTSATDLLNEGAPPFVREVMRGVDKFYQEIYSEKRNFTQKSKFDLVRSKGERRRVKISRAFSLFLDALFFADIGTVAKTKPESIPKHLHRLIDSFVGFFLKDVVEDDDAPQDSDVKGAISRSAAMPVTATTRRRASLVDRLEEQKKCEECDDFIQMTSEGESDDDDAEEEFEVISKSSEEERAGTKPQTAPPGLLPENPVYFGIIVSVGILLFKLLEGNEENVRLDLLVAVSISFSLIGYQIGVSSMIHVESNAQERDMIAPKDAKVAKVQFKEREAKITPVPAAGFAGLLKGSTSLIKKSMKNLIVAPDDAKEEVAAVPAKTFAEFPDGAAIGSHLNCWSAPPCANFHVRGPNYLKDKKKEPSGDYLFPSRGCDLFLTDNPPVNLGQNRSILEGKLRDKPTFIINYRLPWGVFLSYHEIPERFIPFLRRGHGHGDSSAPLPSTANMSAGERALCNFLLSDADEKKEVWKIVPVVVEGPWVVKRVVGGKPAIIGTKMPISYIYQPPEKGLAEYLEADLDIVSSAAARNILAVVRSYTQSLTIDLGYVVQGNKQEELPEQMMLGLRLHGLDPLTAEMLPEYHGGIIPELADDDGYDTE